MSFGSFNGPLYARKWRPGVSRLPVRWWLCDPETGCILGQYISVVKPRAPYAGVVVVSAMVPR